MNITFRVESCSVTNVQALLLSYESRLKVHHSIAVNFDRSFPSTNTVTQGPQRKPSVENYQGYRNRSP